MGTLYSKRPPRRHLIKMVEKRRIYRGLGGGQNGIWLESEPTARCPHFQTNLKTAFFHFYLLLLHPVRGHGQRKRRAAAGEAGFGFFQRKMKMTSILR